MEYPKIKNVFKFDEKYRNILGLNEPYETLKDIEWIGSEKVDGMNIRISWDGHDITIAGHTSKSVIPEHMNKYLSDLFLTQEMEYVFEQIFEDKEVTIFGEGYGYKLQTNGDKYIKDKVSFIVFDININNYWLERKNVEEICERMNLSIVPLVFKGTLDEAKEFVKKHPNSTLSNEHEMEGLVLRPKVNIFDRNGNFITCKLKYRDMIKGGEVIKE